MSEPVLFKRVQFDVHQCEVSDRQKTKLMESTESLARQVEQFPIADLHVLIEHNRRSNDYSVKLTLILPGETLVGNGHDASLNAAFERCLLSLEENVRAYKDRLGQVPERQKTEKATHQDIEFDIPVDANAIMAAVADGDYAGFRTATLGYEDAIRKRVGRWIERYPDVQGRIGKDLAISDLVEDVFLQAFESFDRRPPGERFGEWLGTLIDPVVKAMQHHHDKELENINLVRSALEAEGKPRL